MDAVAKRLKIPSSKIISNIDEYGNTSRAIVRVSVNFYFELLILCNRQAAVMLLTFLQFRKKVL